MQKIMAIEIIYGCWILSAEGGQDPTTAVIIG